MKRIIRSVASACVLGLALALGGCETDASLLDTQLNDALADVTSRISELEGKKQDGGLTRAEKRELRHLKRANKLTARLFNSSAKPGPRILAAFQLLDALDAANSELASVDVILADVAIFTHDVLIEPLGDDSQAMLDLAEGALQRRLEQLFGRAEDLVARGNDLASLEKDPQAMRQYRRAAVLYGRLLQAGISNGLGI